MKNEYRNCKSVKTYVGRKIHEIEQEGFNKLYGSCTLIWTSVVSPSKWVFCYVIILLSTVYNTV